jgi:hypothetical protein
MDPHSIGVQDPDADPEVVKSAEIEGENEDKRQVIHPKKVI